MKKLMVILLLILIGYMGYKHFVKGESVFGRYYKKPGTVKETVKPEEEIKDPKIPGIKKTVYEEPPAKYVLVLELELNNTVLIKSNKIPQGLVRLSGINGDSCNLDFFKRKQLLNKKMKFRQVIDRYGTIEVSLLEVKEKSVIVSMTNSSDREDQLIVVK